MFVDEILTQIQPLSLGQLSKATGLSSSYCLEVRKGIYACRTLGAGRRSGSPLSFHPVPSDLAVESLEGEIESLNSNCLIWGKMGTKPDDYRLR